jgi:hypothetical protein
MDDREESFRRRFNAAARILGVKPEQVVSIKLREDVTSGEEYRQLIENLQHATDVECTELDDDLQGQGYLLEIATAQVVLVEHESGLEILYIAGSIASLVQLVPLVLQSWDFSRGRLWRRGRRTEHSIETRRIDPAGALREDEIPDRQLMESAIGGPPPAVIAASALIEHEMENVFQRLELLSSRVDELEAQLRSKKKPAAKKAAKPKADNQKPKARASKSPSPEAENH